MDEKNSSQWFQKCCENHTCGFDFFFFKCCYHTLVDLLYIVVQISFFICIALCTTDDLEQHVIISLHHSIDGVNHLITFEANHLLHLRIQLRDPTYTRVPGVSWLDSSWNACRFLFFFSPLPPSTLFVAAHFRRLTFFLAKAPDENEKKRGEPGMRTFDPWRRVQTNKPTRPRRPTLLHNNMFKI